jgi:hypothetical protein
LVVTIGDLTRRKIIRDWLACKSVAQILRDYGISKSSFYVILAEFFVMPYEEQLRLLAELAHGRGLKKEIIAAAVRLACALQDNGIDDERIANEMADAFRAWLESVDKDIDPLEAIASVNAASELAEQLGVSVEDLPAKVESLRLEASMMRDSLAEIEKRIEKAAADEKQVLASAKLTLAYIGMAKRLDMELRKLGYTAEAIPLLIAMLQMVARSGHTLQDALRGTAQTKELEKILQELQKSILILKNQAQYYAQLLDSRKEHADMSMSFARMGIGRKGSDKLEDALRNITLETGVTGDDAVYELLRRAGETSPAIRKLGEVLASQASPVTTTKSIPVSPVVAEAAKTTISGTVYSSKPGLPVTASGSFASSAAIIPKIDFIVSPEDPYDAKVAPVRASGVITGASGCTTSFSGYFSSIM